MKTAFTSLPVVFSAICITCTLAVPAAPAQAPVAVPYKPQAPVAVPYKPTSVTPAASSGSTLKTLPLEIIALSGLAGTAIGIANVFGGTALGFSPLIITAGKKKRSTGTHSFLEALRYFDLAMEFDSEFCLPLVLCEAASKQNKKATKLQKAAAKTAKVG